MPAEGPPNRDGRLERSTGEDNVAGSPIGLCPFPMLNVGQPKMLPPRRCASCRNNLTQDTAGPCRRPVGPCCSIEGQSNDPPFSRVEPCLDFRCMSIRQALGDLRVIFSLASWSWTSLERILLIRFRYAANVVMSSRRPSSMARNGPSPPWASRDLPHKGQTQPIFPLCLRRVARRRGDRRAWNSLVSKFRLRVPGPL